MGLADPIGDIEIFLRIYLRSGDHIRQEVDDLAPKVRP